MANRLTREMRELRAAEPGERFQAGYHRTKVDSRIMRVSLVVLGIALMVAAAVTFWLPGPNFVLVFAGLALVGGQSETVARVMDHGEVAARRWHSQRWKPYPHKTRAKAVIALIVATLVGLGVWFAADQGWLPEWIPLIARSCSRCGAF